MEIWISNKACDVIYTLNCRHLMEVVEIHSGMKLTSTYFTILITLIMAGFALWHYQIFDYATGRDS